MTLKEKLFNVIFDNLWEHKEDRIIPEVEKRRYAEAQQCALIAEDFALEFGRWLNNKVINPSGKHHNLLGIVKVDTLLVIFKKEKGL